MKTRQHTKKGFADQFDFEGLKYASQVRVLYAKGHAQVVRVDDYWPTGENLADLLVGHVMEGSTAGGAVELCVPSPDILSIEILDSFDHENHGSHPEVGYAFQYISDLYKDASAKD